MSTILGLGLDATEIDRIAATIERYGGRRLPSIHFAGRFAAKEAGMKALGTGHSQNVLWRDVEVIRHGGPPQLRFHGGAARRFAAMDARASLLSITHTETLAFAQVLLIGR